MTSEIKGSIKPYTPLTGKIKEGASGGTNNYDVLVNKPRINDVELRGNKTFDELGMIECSNKDIEEMFK